uniref:Uncharacterized protein n=1 Tax=Amphimedon queenslandica TaxID=400682 RepID=A0A1X7THC1_AMPQE
LKKKFSQKSLSRGSGAYVRDDTCVYTVWRDIKCDAVVSNEHSGHSEETVVRNVK